MLLSFSFSERNGDVSCQKKIKILNSRNVPRLEKDYWLATDLTMVKEMIIVLRSTPHRADREVPTKDSVYTCFLTLSKLNHE